MGLEVASQGLVHGPLGTGAVHLCIDMQRLFLPEGPWPMSWMAQILPNVVALAEKHPERTIFTRFVPVNKPEDAVGAWKRYYQRWDNVTLAKLNRVYVDLAPELQRFVPPSQVVDKWVYSPWMDMRLQTLLAESGINTVIITGGETDVCVLAAVLGAIDRGYRTVIVADAVCGSADQTHDALMTVYRSRFTEQVELATTEEVLDGWR